MITSGICQSKSNELTNVRSCATDDRILTSAPQAKLKMSMRLFPIDRQMSPPRRELNSHSHGEAHELNRSTAVPSAFDMRV